MKRFIFAVLSVAGLVICSWSETVFNDTFQGPNDTPPNIDYIQRQTNGLIVSSYPVAIRGNAVNGIRLLDTSYPGDETAMVFRMYNPATGAESTTAVQLSSDFDSYLEGAHYTISLDSRIISGGGDPAVSTTWFGVGIIGSADKAFAPMSVNTDFGLQLNASGGGVLVYADGTLVYSNNNSSVSFGERFFLTLNVDETEPTPTVQVLVQAEGDIEVDLGTFDFDINPTDTKRFLQLRGYTKDDDLTSGGLMTVEVYEMSVTTP